MTFDEAIPIVKQKYGILAVYIDAGTGKMMTVVRAEAELNSIPGLDRVAFTDSGIALFSEDIIGLASEKVTIKELLQRKNPDLLAAAAKLGSKGGKAIAQRGPEYFRQLQARRSEHKGGRPKKELPEGPE
jgi:hypothetical protein